MLAQGAISSDTWILCGYMGDLEGGRRTECRRAILWQPQFHAERIVPLHKLTDG